LRSRWASEPRVKGIPADGLAGLERADLGDDAPLAQLSQQQIEAAEPEIAAEDSADPLRLSVINADLSTLGVIAASASATRGLI